MSPLAEVAVLFLRLGFTAFGGPAAHVGILHDEVVVRRRWLDDRQFLDLLGATNLIPGPNSTEMCIHVGYLRAGWPGLIAAGLGFILPAAGMVLGLAMLYVRYGSTPQAAWLLNGIKPVVIAIIAQALWSLGRKALKSRLALVIAIAVLGLYFAHINELLLLFAGGLLLMLISNAQRLHTPPLAVFLPFSGLALSAIAAPFSLPLLFLTFLKIGSVLYGSGYVLLAFLRSDFVLRLGWLTDQQLIDAVAIGQLTPGPLFTAATFIGYILGGATGALLATLGIFLPSFILVAASNPLIPRMRESAWLGSLLDGINASSLGLMAAVSMQLGISSFTGASAIMIGLVAFYLLARYRINSTWLIAGGAAAGLISHLLP